MSGSVSGSVSGTGMSSGWSGRRSGQVQDGVGCQVYHPAVCPAVYLVEECQVDVKGQVQVESQIEGAVHG